MLQRMDHVAEWIVGLVSWIWDEIAAWAHRRRRNREEDPTKCCGCQYSLEGTLQAKKRVHGCDVGHLEPGFPASLGNPQGLRKWH